MGWRITITSSNGQEVDQRFGQATRFYMVDLEADGSFRLLEALETSSYCKQCGGARKDLEELLNRVSGCTAVLTLKVGDFVQEVLREQGIDIFQQSGAVKDLLPKIGLYYRRIAERGNHCGI